MKKDKPYKAKQNANAATKEAGRKEAAPTAAKEPQQQPNQDIITYIRNIRGFQTSVEDIAHDLEQMKTNNEPRPHIIGLTETMHYNDFIENEITFEGYTLLHQQTADKELEFSGRAKGGMLVFKRNDAEVPIQIQRKYHTIRDCLPIAITETRKKQQKKGTMLLMYYLRPEKKKPPNTKMPPSTPFRKWLHNMPITN